MGIRALLRKKDSENAKLLLTRKAFGPRLILVGGMVLTTTKQSCKEEIMQSITIKTIDNSQSDAVTLGVIDLNGITTSGFAPETIADIALVALATGEWECQFSVELHGFPEGDERLPAALVFIHDAIAQQCEDVRCFFDWHARVADENGVVDLTGSDLEDVTLRNALEAGVIVVARSELHYIVDDGGCTLRVASGAEFLSAYDEEYEAYCESQFGEEDGAW